MKSSYLCTMQHLILAILCSTGVFVVMRLFERYGIDNHRGIAANYATATIIGMLMVHNYPTVEQVVEAPWLELSLLTGFWFIFTYLLMSYSSQRAGIAVTSLSSKLSVVIPTLLGIFYFGDKTSVTLIIGIALALVALVLIVGKKKGDSSTVKSSGWIVALPVIIFFGTGIGDVLMKFTERLSTATNMNFMIAFIYFIALLFGLLIVLFDKVKGKSRFHWKNTVGGIVLGVVNFFSTYCMYQCMRIFDNVYLFPIYNIGVVIATTLCGVLLFKEKLSAKNYIGLALAILAVILITQKA